MFKTSMNILRESGSCGGDELNESWAAERRRDNLIDEQSKCVGGETDKLEGWEMNEWWTNLD